MMGGPGMGGPPPQQQRMMGGPGMPPGWNPGGMPGMPPQYPPMFGGGMPPRPGMPGMPLPFPGHHPMGMGGPGGPPMMPHHQQPPPPMMGMGMGFPGPFGQQHQHQPGMPPLPFPPAGMPFPYGAPPGSLPHMPPGMMGMGTYTLPPHLRHNNTIQPVATATTRPPPDHHPRAPLPPFFFALSLCSAHVRNVVRSAHNQILHRVSGTCSALNGGCNYPSARRAHGTVPSPTTRYTCVRARVCVALLLLVVPRWPGVRARGGCCQRRGDARP
jgi:hypothetical protein